MQRVIRRRFEVIAIAGCVAIAACSGSSTRSSSSTRATTSTATAGTTTTLPPSRTVWLCRPGLTDNPCEASESATVVSATGATTQKNNAPAKNPKIDCFYVYPTVSGQPTPLADLHIDPELRAIAVTQASRFSQVCRVFAPVYRQSTIASITGTATPGAYDRNTGYRDVRDAWNDYLARDNHGRGVVFLGHSQGAGVLTRLLKEQVDPKPAVRGLLVSALLLGGNVTVPRGRDVGGDFQHIPACRSFTQLGCVVAYSTFLQAPPANTYFGRAGAGPRGGDSPTADLQVLCVNPAAPAGGSARTSSYWTTSKFPGVLGVVGGAVPKAGTPWVAFPDRYLVRCMTTASATWLQVTPVSDDVRPIVAATLGPPWGLHLYDFNLALGDLVEMVGREAKAFQR